jgi:cation/acetate symporter
MTDQALSLSLFAIFVLVTLGITIWASRQTRTATDFYAAGRRIHGWQNGVAISGDYMSAASFLGIAGLISLFGYDGFLYSVGWLVAYGCASGRCARRRRCPPWASPSST